MKITIIFPRYPFSERVPVVPPILEYLAALTLRIDPYIEVELIDANQTPVDPSALETDLVAISIMTVTAPWAYRFADACRLKGIPVVLGGIHPTVLPEEAILHADAVVIGEAESVWGEVLSDAGAGRLQGFYQGRRLPLDGLPMPVDYHKLRQELFRLDRILKRISKIPLRGFPSTHFLSFMKEIPMKRQLRVSYNEWFARNRH